MELGGLELPTWGTGIRYCSAVRQPRRPGATLPSAVPERRLSATVGFG